MIVASSGLARRSLALAVAFGLVFAIPVIALAHAVVFPKASATGAYERYVLRVPNERAVTTTRVEMRFPAEVKVNSFADVPGWTLEVVKDSAQRIIGAVWTGTLAPNRFIEFPFVAVNPKTAANIQWPAIQTYADGERVEWNGPEGSKTPASVTKIAAAVAAGDDVSHDGRSMQLSVVALVLAIMSLGLALRKR